MPNNVLKLNRKAVECLTVKIEDKTYNIPLGTSLKRKELAKLNKEDEVMNFFSRYIDCFDDLSIGEIKQIVTAWSKATEDASGLTLGES